jgi:penicillin-binding protein 1A
MSSRWWYYILAFLSASVLVGGEVVVLVAILLYPRLPPIYEVTHYRPQLPLRIYTADGTLIGEFGEERRAIVNLRDVPRNLKFAILAAEDARFYKHGAIDLMGILRASIVDLNSGAERQGASTITMQLVRNLFLNPEKTFNRKFSEILLAYKVEHTLTKDQILNLYINQIYLGQRAYGFAAAAQVYFGKHLDQLTLKEAAILAGLPKAPSRFNPVANPKLALERGRYVLLRMKKLGYITDAQYRNAIMEPLWVVHGKSQFRLDADYVAEMVRQQMYDQFGEDAYTMGYSVYTTLRDNDQNEANIAVRDGVMAYDMRHDYRGPEGFFALNGNPEQRHKTIERALKAVTTVNGLEPAIVLHTGSQEVTALLKGGKTVHISGPGLEFAKRALHVSARAKLRIRAGSLIRVQRDVGGRWEVVQLPQVEAALVSLDSKSGAILALCGGFDFGLNQFNHVTQAFRQPGSSFKPFIYSAALEKGFTPATIINDAPIIVPPSYPGGKPWAPGNYENDFLGPITLRYALAESRNVDAVRVIEKIGVPYARDYASRFGFPVDQIPPYPSMVLGAGSFTPLQMAAAYAVFANGGFGITPYLVERIMDGQGNIVFQAKPQIAGKDAPQVITPRNAFVMTSLLQDVIKYGTASRARALGRHDLAGKTGTTENFVDAWFEGYNPERLAVAWMGFDQPRSLGKDEPGARAALPIWMEYMGNVLKGMPDLPYAMPQGVVSVLINPADGKQVPPGHPGVPDYFYQESIPPLEDSALNGEEVASPAPTPLTVPPSAMQHTEGKSNPLQGILNGPRNPYGRKSKESKSSNANELKSEQAKVQSSSPTIQARKTAELDAQSEQMIKFADAMLANKNFSAASELAEQVLRKYPHNAHALYILNRSKTGK